MNNKIVIKYLFIFKFFSMWVILFIKIEIGNYNDHNHILFKSNWDNFICKCNFEQTWLFFNIKYTIELVDFFLQALLWLCIILKYLLWSLYGLSANNSLYFNLNHPTFINRSSKSFPPQFILSYIQTNNEIFNHFLICCFVLFCKLNFLFVWIRKKNI